MLLIIECRWIRESQAASAKEGPSQLEYLYDNCGNAAAGTRIRMLVSMLEEKENQWSRAAQRESSHRISLRNFWNFC
ncbi:hypothetical protein Y032_0893g2903 [Ancylostoma ceylanicum]|uniref:Uncharacterized protein n=1 Tax=Ancylostoma ceylanicum TaxID=53326 RepID=A0A016WA42_9BILA|nr:hypothetical protein Y032_0893g2903 [Ancylostoma ceylanicum]